jgi:hypothetical protein
MKRALVLPCVEANLKRGVNWITKGERLTLCQEALKEKPRDIRGYDFARNGHSDVP